MHEIYPRARQTAEYDRNFAPVVVREAFLFPWGEVVLIVPERELNRPRYSWEYWRKE